MSNNGKIKLSENDAILYLKTLYKRKTKRMGVYEKDVKEKKIKASDVPFFMYCFMHHILDSLHKDKGVEDDDLLEAALYYKFPEKPRFF